MLSREELIRRLSGPFFTGFADVVAREVLDAGAESELYLLATESAGGLPAALRQRIGFRSAYVLERICFAAPERFAPFAGDFLQRGFFLYCGAGAQRSFAKMAVHLLGKRVPDEEAVVEALAARAAEWAVDPRTKIAARVHAVEIVDLCRRWLPWAEQMWDDLLEVVAADPAPALRACMRGWRGRR